MKRHDHMMTSEQRISLRAYAFWEAEGRPEGRDVEHWLKAEEALRAEAAGDATPDPTGSDPAKSKSPGAKSAKAGTSKTGAAKSAADAPKAENTRARKTVPGKTAKAKVGRRKV